VEPLLNTLLFSPEVRTPH